MEDRAARNGDEREYGSYPEYHSPDRRSPGSAASASPSKLHRYRSGATATRIRNQALNKDENIPGEHRKIDPERELYSDFKVRFGLERPEETNLIISPEADFRRK